MKYNIRKCNTRSLWTAAVLTLAAAIVVFAADIRTDYSHSTDFNHFRTYSWLKVQGTDSLWQGRIQHDIDAELAMKGWQMVPSGGDVALTAIGSTHNEQQLNTFYDSFGGGWGWRGFGGDGESNTTVENVPVGTLNVDIFNAQTKKLIWRSTAQNTLSGKADKDEKSLKETVAKMFKNFPPKPKG